MAWSRRSNGKVTDGPEEEDNWNGNFRLNSVSLPPNYDCGYKVEEATRYVMVLNVMKALIVSKRVVWMLCILLEAVDPTVHESNHYCKCTGKRDYA